jgi:hypothetical protein
MNTFDMHNDLAKLNHDINDSKNSERIMLVADLCGTLY